MKHVTTILMCMALVALIACARDSPVAHTWTVWMEDGKTDTVEIDNIDFTNLSTSYFDTLLKITNGSPAVKPNTFRTPDERASYFHDHLTITDIGPWGKYHVLDLTNVKMLHKSIILKDAAGHYWIVYVQSSGCTANVDALPTINNVNGHEILSYKTSIPGTGNQCIELHFIYDTALDRPRLIDTSSIDKAITNTVPAGWGVWKGGGLDFLNLTYSQGVWKPDDANCCPTGGRIDLRLALEDSQVQVTDIQYRPELVVK